MAAAGGLSYQIPPRTTHVDELSLHVKMEIKLIYTVYRRRGLGSVSCLYCSMELLLSLILREGREKYIINKIKLLKAERMSEVKKLIYGT